MPLDDDLVDAVAKALDECTALPVFGKPGWEKITEECRVAARAALTAARPRILEEAAKFYDVEAANCRKLAAKSARKDHYWDGATDAYVAMASHARALAVEPGQTALESKSPVPPPTGGESRALAPPGGGETGGTSAAPTAQDTSEPAFIGGAVFNPPTPAEAVTCGAACGRCGGAGEIPGRFGEYAGTCGDCGGTGHQQPCACTPPCHCPEGSAGTHEPDCDSDVARRGRGEL